MADRPLRVLDSPNFLILSFLFHVFPKIISVLKSPTYDFEIGRDPTDMMVVLDIPKGPSSYNCLTKLDQLLHRYTHVDDYIYWAPRPNEELSMSDCCEITMYKDCFDGGLMLSLHPFFFFLSQSSMNSMLPESHKSQCMEESAILLIPLS